MTAKATVQAADFVKSPRVRHSAALSALMWVTLRGMCRKNEARNPGLYLPPAILDTITPCMTDCMIPKIAGLRPSDFLWGNRIGKM